MKNEKLKLKIGNKTHPIIIGKNAILALPDHIPHDTSRVVLICDVRLKKILKEICIILKKTNFPLSVILVKAGEGLKDIDSAFPIYGELLALKADRKSILIAIGGGSVGDVTGFIAATYLRGVKWIGVPTTLLAQVDSSVGGKTGINHPMGKNLIGAFHQPQTVICDTSFLASLSSREINSGLGEIIKYALVFDAPFFSWLEKNLPKLLSLSPLETNYAIKRSLSFKCKVVSIDEHDVLGIREVLNFGHTFGHGLESVTNYKTYQHGEAVILGMRFAVALSYIKNKINNKKRKRIDLFLQRIKVPLMTKELKAEKIFKAMKKDKKSEGDFIRFVLLDKIGRTLSEKDISPNDLKKSFDLITSSVERKLV